jgi:hypothetical protein
MMRSRDRSRRRLFRPARPAFERLEMRTVPSTFTFNPVADGLVADRNLDGVYDAVDTTSTSVSDRYFDASVVSGIGQERDIFEFDLSAIAPGTPIASATLGLDVLGLTTGEPLTQVSFEAYHGTGTITTADGASAALAAGSGSVSSVGWQSFTLTPNVLESLEGEVVALRLENPALNSKWIQISDTRNTSHPNPMLTLVFSPPPPPPNAATFTPVADGLVADRNLDGVYDAVDTTSPSISNRDFDATHAPGIGEERGVFEFDLSRIAPGTPIASATLGLDTLLYTTGGPIPQVSFEAYHGTGTITTADGASAALAAGNGTVTGLGWQSFTLAPSVLQSFEGEIVAIRLENPTINSNWFRVGDMRTSDSSKPMLTLVLNPPPPPNAVNLNPAADGQVADQDFDGVYDAVDTTSTTISDRNFDATYAPGIGEERGVFEFDLSRITPGTPITSATLGLNVVSYTHGATSFPQVSFEAYRGTGTITTADGASAALAAGSGSVTGLGWQSFTLTPSVLQSFEGGIVAVRLENATLDSDWFQVSDSRDTTNPKPLLTLMVDPAPPAAAADHYTVAQGGTLTTVAQAAGPAPLLRYNFDEASSGNAPVQDTGQVPAAPGTLTGGATRTPSTPGLASAGALDLSTPGSDTVNAGHVSKLDPLTAMTVTAWINLRSSSSNSGKELISDVDTPGTLTSGWDLRLTTPFESHPLGTTAVTFNVFNSSGGGQGKASTSFTPNDRWLFIAVTFDTNRVATLYEGDTATAVAQLGQSGSFAYGLAPNVSSLIIGGAGSSPTAAANTPPAWLDDVRIFGSALTPAQVDAVRQDNLPTGLLANDTSPAGLPLTASVVSGPAHGSLTLNGDGTFSYTPAAGYFGPDSFTYQDSDGTNTSVPATVTLNVVAPPAATADQYAVAENGVLNVAAASGVLANDTDPNGLPLSATLQGAPAHGTVTLNPDGSFTYTPANGYFGIDRFRYVDNDGPVSGNATTVTVNVDAPPTDSGDTYATPKNTTLTVAAPGVLANDTDPNGLPLSASVVTQPAHGTLALNADGSFVYTPAAGYVGSDSFTYQASDGVATGNTATVVLEVSPPAAAADSAAVNENETLTVAAPGVLANDTDPNGLPLSATVVNPPAHGTLALNADGSFSYTPAAGYFGTDSFSYQANDGTVSSLPATVTITVNQVGTISGTVWDDMNASGTRVSSDPGLAGRTVFLDLNHNGQLDPGELSTTTAADGTYTIKDVPPGTYSVVAVLPTGWAQTSPFSPTSRTVTVPVQTPALIDFSDLASPYDRVINIYQAAGYTISVSSPSPGNFLVAGSNDSSRYAGAPALAPQTYVATMSLYRPDGLPFALQSIDLAPTIRSFSGAVTFTGTRPDNTQVSQSASFGTGLSFHTTRFTNLTNVKRITWIFSNSSNDTQFTNLVLVAGGTPYLTGVDFGQARASGPAPVAAADAYAGVMSSTLTVTAAAGVLANDTSPQGDPIRATLVTAPSHGTLTLNADGSFSYVPTPFAGGFSGPDSFTYKVSDGYLSSSPVTVSLAIDRPPATSADAYALATNTTLTRSAATGVLANDRDWNGLPLTAALVSGPAHGAVTVNADGSFTYTPTAGYSGTDSFTYKASDGVSSSGTTTVALTVTPGPLAAGDGYLVQAGTPLTVPAAAGVLANDTDPNGLTMTAALVGGPSGGSLSFNADGSFTYTPPSFLSSGAVTFTYRASDGTSTGNTATVTLTIDTPPAVTNDAYSVNAGSTLTTAPGVSSLLIDSQLGDVVGHGLYKELDTRTGWFTAQLGLFAQNSIQIDYRDFGYGEYGALEDWSLLFEMPNHTTFLPGTYLGATRAPFEATTAPGLDVSGDGSGANTSNGQFTVSQVNYDASGNLISFAASFVQYGDNSSTPMLGQVQYNATGNQPGGVLVNDRDAAHLALTASVVSGPSHGSLSWNADGSFSYTPNSGYVGNDTFVYQASDGLFTSAPATVTLKVEAPPAAAADSYNAAENTPLAVPAAAGVLANDTDPNGDPLTAALVAGPAHGAVTLNADGSFTYTPVAGFVGSDSFTYKANDGQLDGNIATVSLTVNSTPAAASFAGSDVITQGAWKGSHGASGYDIAGDNSASNPSLPSYVASVSLTGGSTYVYQSSTSDPRALQQSGATSRIAAVWYAAPSFTITVNMADAAVHRVSLYAMDEDSNRSEQLEVIDPATGQVLDTRSIANFDSGVYLAWDVLGGVTFRVTRTAGSNAVISGLFFDPVSATAAFVKADPTTQGAWKGSYGASGYDIAGDNSAGNPSLPAYVTSVSLTGTSTYTYQSSTSDPRALQQAGATSRIAAVWYAAPSFTITVNMADSAIHRVALYAMDEDSNRSERIDVIDPATGQVLDTRQLTDFASGSYLVWNVSGSVTFKVTSTAGVNAVISGLFFDPVATTAAFVKSDSTTQGAWKSSYGTSGYDIAADTSANNPGLPSFVSSVSLTGDSTYVYQSSTSDPRALQQAGATSRIAAVWYAAPSFSINVNMADAAVHQVALYAMDEDSNRSERIDVIDPATGQVIDTRQISSFSSGVYLVWNVSGSVTFKVTSTAGVNAVISGLFFDPVATTAAFVKSDSTTQGAWKSAYGASGYDIAGDIGPNNPSLAAYVASVSLTGASTYTYVASTSDPRALQQSGSTNRIAAVWYAAPSFTITVNMADTAVHQVALYAMDEDSNRSEQIEVIDPATGQVLDTRQITSFSSGVYLVWNVSGSVAFRVTRTAGSNAVISGLFFDPAP